MAKKLDNGTNKGYVFHLVYWDANGKRYQTRKTNNKWTKAEAEAIERATIQKLKQKGYVFKKSSINNDTYKPVTIAIGGKDVLKSEVSLEMVVESFLNSRLSFLRPSTVKRMEYTFKNHLFDYFGKDTPIESITSSQLEDYKLYLMDKHSSDNTNSKRISELKNLFKYARQNLGLDNILITDDFIIRSDSCKSDEYTIITPSEYNRFINTFNEENDGDDALKYKVFFALLYTCSARKGEINALTWKKIDLINRKIRINETYSPIAGDNMNINATKTKIDITKPVLDVVYDDLKTLYDEATSYKNFSETDFIFNKDRPIPNTTLTRIFKKHLKLANLKDMRIHDFRHSSATALYNTCDNIVATSKFIGHKSTTMSMHYVHPSEQDFRKIGNTLNSMITNNVDSYNANFKEELKEMLRSKLSTKELIDIKEYISNIIEIKASEEQNALSFR